MNGRDRERFDRLVDVVVEALPQRIRDLLEEVPLIVDDEPSRELLREIGMTAEEAGELCGLHTGVPLTERSVDHSGDLPDVIHIFRRGIVEQAGGWQPGEDEDGEATGGEGEVQREIRITILHEIGHHFGLDEDDLAALGYD